MRRAETLGAEITRRGLTHEQAAILGGVQPSTRPGARVPAAAGAQ
jgi:hypothetical protein